MIDPERDVDRYEKLAAANELRIVAVAETHIHADFISGVRDLIRVGLDRFCGWCDAGTLDAFVAAGGRLLSTPEVSVQQARVMLDTSTPFLLDVRRKTEFIEGHIAGATNIAHTRLLSRLAEVPRDTPILVNCRSGARSSRACSLLQRHGYEVTNLAGGMLAWEQATVPVAR